MSELTMAAVLGCKRTPALLLLAISLTLPCFASADDETVTASSPRWQWIEGKRDQVSYNVALLASSLDGWLAGDIDASRANESYLNIRLQHHVGSFDGLHSKLKVGGSLDLPRASERWKLIYESDPDELNSLEDIVLGESTSGESVGGISYRQEISNSFELSYDVGLRSRLPVDPFYRIRARYGHALNDRWSLGLRQKVWYYKNDGWGYDTDLSFTRRFDSGDFFSVNTEFKYQQSDREMEFSQSATYHRSLSQLNSLDYSVGLLGRNEPNLRIDDYYVEARYRHAIRDDWLFVELVPQLIVSRDDHWRPQPRLFLNLEMLFFDF